VLVTTKHLPFGPRLSGSRQPATGGTGGSSGRGTPASRAGAPASRAGAPASLRSFSIFRPEVSFVCSSGAPTGPGAESSVAGGSLRMTGVEASGGTTRRGLSGMSNKPLQPARNTHAGNTLGRNTVQTDANAPSVPGGRNAAAHLEETRNNLIGATRTRSELTLSWLMLSLQHRVLRGTSPAPGF
jgi:hypothetical protein